MARANPGHPRLLVLNDPFQGLDGVLLFPDLLLKTIETFQDQTHVDAHLIDILSMTVHSTSDMVNLFLVVLEGLLLGNNIGPEVSLQTITLTRTVNSWLKSTKRLPLPSSPIEDV